MELREEICKAAIEERARPRYGDFVESLLKRKRKIATGELSTEKSQRSWSDAQDLHLMPYFEDWYVDAIRRRDIETWKTTQGEKIQAKKFSPNTANGWLRVLLSTLRTAVVELELEHDPTVGVKPFDTSTWNTYTEEEPNALTADEVPAFMAQARLLWRQHYAQLFLGISTGRRPCELRPLRRRGPNADIKWEEGVLLVRRSQVIGEPVERTKGEDKLRITLPQDLMQSLREHVEAIPKGPMADSDLLFPSRVGGYQSANVLSKPIKAIATAAKISKHLSPYFMRRTFKDLCRAAAVHDFVAMAISGHATFEMHERYSSVSRPEMTDGLAKVVDLMDYRRALNAAKTQGGESSGDPAKEALDRG